MSRPEELPRSASPLKRRAGSMPPDGTPEAAEDIDMISLPATASSDVPIVDSDSNRGTEEVEQEADADTDANADADADDVQDDASTAAQADVGDEDIPDLLGLDMDRSSVEEVHVGSDTEDNNLVTNKPDGKDAQEQNTEQGKGSDENSSEGKTQTQVDSSTTNSDGGADSDSKTVDTVATSTSADAPAKNPLLTGTSLESGINGKFKGNRSGRNSPAPLGPATRGRQSKSDRVSGLTGLSNLGNTCYMASALQCIRSVEELTKYFLADAHSDELNYDNPLGHGGNVAHAYAFLLHMIYKNPPPMSVTPRSFKDTVGRYAPQFSGWAQQDSQEFLGFLLDGLQEDLNRVKKKPYIEKPDSTDDMVGNQEKIRELASKVWGIHKARDDSVIGDLFTGLYKSTLVCPTCDKVSITFEPFNNLTLPLPVQNVWHKKVKFFPLNDRPVNIIVEIDKTASIKTLKEFISSRVGVPPERMVGAEEYKEKFFKLYDDSQQASEEISKDDFPVFFEVEAQPTNFQKKKKKSYKTFTFNDDDDVPSPDDPMTEQLAEHMLVPVMHRLNPRLNKDTRTQGARSLENISPPHFIILNAEDARDEDRIRRKILEKVATFTTRPQLSSVPIPNKETFDNSDQDHSLINTSDADSSGDGRVTVKSVEGEDGYVDVSMQDVATQPETEVPSNLLKKFNTQRPEWVDPAVFLDGQFQSLFDMSFFSERTMIPTGWSTVGSNPDKLFPRLDTRKPRPPTPAPSDEDMPSPSGSGTASEESSTEETPDTANSVGEGQTRMVDESSEEEPPEVKDFRIPPPKQPLKLRGGKKKMKGYKTYSKKGQKRFNKQQIARQSYQHQQPASIFDEDPEWGSKADGGPLVRLGEGIIVDWNPELWDAVFGRDQDAENKDAKYATFNNKAIETLKDPQLEAKIQERRARSGKGISLHDCLDEFEKKEILSEEDKWYCPRCKEFCRAEKKFDLWQTPDILIVHLKRFSSAGHRRDKIDATVDFPIEGLDITRRVLEKNDSKKEIYDLIAIDDHMGGLGGGHYTAFAKNFVDGAWYKFDDSMVSPVKDTQRMITSHAYLLFYRRRSDRPLGGPKLEEVMRGFERSSEETNDDITNNNEGTESR